MPNKADFLLINYYMPICNRIKFCPNGRARLVSCKEKSWGIGYNKEEWVLSQMSCNNNNKARHTTRYQSRISARPETTRRSECVCQLGMSGGDEGMNATNDG